MPNKNVQVVKEAYAAFQVGDSERLFGAMTPDIDWESLGRASDFPTLGPRSGTMEVREFFGLVAETMEFHAFSPREFHAVGNIVFVFGSYDATVRKTGRRAACEWLHVFWVSDGKVSRFREYTDTARFAEAWRS
jgi:ketosteroid isomerase-like protein